MLERPTHFSYSPHIPTITHTDTHTERIQSDKTMADKLMYILNDKTQNYPFCRLKLVVETFGNSTSSHQNLLKVPLVFKPKINKTLFKTFGD